MTHVHIYGAVGLGALVSANGDGLEGVLAWLSSSVGSSDSASAGLALAESLVACLLIAVVVSFLRRSRL